MAYCYERKYKLEYKSNDQYIKQFYNLMKILEMLHNEFFFEFNAMYSLDNFHDVQSALYEFFGSRRYSGNLPTTKQTINLYNKFSLLKQIVNKLNQLKKGKNNGK